MFLIYLNSIYPLNDKVLLNNEFNIFKSNMVILLGLN